MALHQTHSDITASLTKLQLNDAAFHKDVEAQRGALLASLTEEMVETSFTRDGKSVKETLQIGQRIEAFKTMLVTKEAELTLYWAEWEKVQAKIVQLGIEVLGAEAFGGTAGHPSEKKGYRKDLEEFDMEHQIWLEEIKEEIQLVGEESVKKMTSTEKVGQHSKGLYGVEEMLIMLSAGTRRDFEERAGKFHCSGIRER